MKQATNFPGQHYRIFKEAPRKWFLFLTAYSLSVVASTQKRKIPHRLIRCPCALGTKAWKANGGTAPPIVNFTFTWTPKWSASGPGRYNPSTHCKVG
jgi:hypothetical protein